MRYEIKNLIELIVFGLIIGSSVAALLLMAHYAPAVQKGIETCVKTSCLF